MEIWEQGLLRLSVHPHVKCPKGIGSQLLMNLLGNGRSSMARTTRCPGGRRPQEARIKRKTHGHDCLLCAGAHPDNKLSGPSNLVHPHVKCPRARGVSVLKDDRFFCRTINDTKWSNSILPLRTLRRCVKPFPSGNKRFRKPTLSQFCPSFRSPLLQRDLVEVPAWGPVRGAPRLPKTGIYRVPSSIRIEVDTGDESVGRGRIGRPTQLTVIILTPAVDFAMVANSQSEVVPVPVLFVFRATVS